MGLLDDYQKMVEEDKKNLNNDAPVNGVEMTDEERKQYEKRLNEMREEIDNNKDCGIDCEKAWNTGIKKLDRYEETDIKTEDYQVMPKIRRAFCPVCGKEIINNTPTMFNPFSLEKTNPYKCNCGWQADLEYAYPRVYFVDLLGNEIEAYAK